MFTNMTGAWKSRHVVTQMTKSCTVVHNIVSRITAVVTPYSQKCLSVYICQADNAR